MVLILDFDGVLHPDYGARFSRLPLLEAWLRSHPDVDVVVSSSWREQEPLEQLRTYFAGDLRPRIIGTTPLYRRLADVQAAWDEVGDQPTTPRQREVEIRRWLRDSADPARPWVALDDQSSGFHPGTAELLLTKSKVGLTASDMDELSRRRASLRAPEATPPGPRTRRP